MGNWISSEQPFPLTLRNRKRYGWIRDLPDKRDVLAQLPMWAALPEIPNVDLRDTGQMPEVYDQGNLGSCTAQAIAAAYEFDARKQKATEYFTPSRLFIYYNERLIEGTPMIDSGASLRDGLRVLRILGAPPEPVYPYDTSRFAIEPPLSAYRIAQKHKVTRYRRVPQNTSILSAIYMGYPVIFGMSVYDHFESEEFQKEEVLKVPDASESLLGGHAVLLCGYRTMPDRTIQFLVRNSWGSKWHTDGYFWMEYGYVMDPNLCSDFWVIETVSEIPKAEAIPEEAIPKEAIPEEAIPKEAIPKEAIPKEAIPKEPELTRTCDNEYMFTKEESDDEV